MIERERFRTAYRQAVREVVPFITPERQEVIARHNLGLLPQNIDLALYLEMSELRYVRVVDRLNAAKPGVAPNELQALDIGGFLGALPLALVRCGSHVTLVEEYDYYYGAFDDLKAFLEGEGVGVWAADFTQPLEQVPEKRYTLVTNMAMLEHLSSSPKALLENIRAVIEHDGVLAVDVPNLAYWPTRLRALRGVSVHPSLDHVYRSEPPFLGHHREYTVAELRQVLTWSGFEVSSTETFNYTPQTLVGNPLRRLFTLLVDVLPTRLFESCREVILAVARPAG